MPGDENAGKRARTPAEQARLEKMWAARDAAAAARRAAAAELSAPAEPPPPPAPPRSFAEQILQEAEGPTVEPEGIRSAQAEESPQAAAEGVTGLGSEEPTPDLEDESPDPVETEYERRVREERAKADAAWLEREKAAVAAEALENAKLFKREPPPPAELDRMLEEAFTPPKPPAQATRLPEESSATLPRAATILRRYLSKAATRLANGRDSRETCQLCEMSGVHGRIRRCNCPCHEARAWLRKYDGEAEDGRLQAEGPSDARDAHDETVGPEGRLRGLGELLTA